MNQRQSVSLAAIEHRNQKELEVIRQQKIFTCCNYQQSKL